MATRTSVAAGLTEAFVREQVASAHQSQRPLPLVVFEAKTEEGDTAWRSLAGVLRCRAGGFMVVLPLAENVASYLENWVDGEGSPFVLSYVVEVDMETARGRLFGKDSVLLADFPWELLGSFRRAPTSRTQEALGDILRFKQQNTVLRPNALSAWEASEQWVANPESEENQFQEYVTAAEEDAKEMEEQDPPAPLEDADQGDQADILRQMQARLLELESRAVTAQSKAAPSPPSRNLFGTQPQGNLSTATWSKLQAAAGPAPSRLGRFEAGSRAGHPRIPATQDNFLEAEVEAEAVAKDELTALVSTMTDPMQKLLALQLKQNQDLLARVLPKQQDSIATALSGLGNEGGSSSTGVRGCTAREAYLKQMEDHSMVARCVLQNAMKDMGVSTPYPGLMRDYLERRMPLGEMKLLTLFGYFLAHAWETAFLAQDEIFLGFASRGLMMVEQAAMDGGKTQMGWLLTALPEPNWALVNQNRKRQGIQPFARLCQPSWIAANVAFLKDLDFLDNRMRSSGNKLEKESTPSDEPDKSERRIKKQWPKAKAKADRGGGDGGSSSANQ